MRSVYDLFLEAFFTFLLGHLHSCASSLAPLREASSKQVRSEMQRKLKFAEIKLYRRTSYVTLMRWSTVFVSW